MQTNIIVGDLNCPKIDWPAASCSSDCISKSLLKFTVEAGFSQFVDFATRGSNILDVILADDDQVITEVTSDPPIGHSDHLMIKFKLALETAEAVRVSAPNTTQYRWFMADFDAMEAFLLDVDWQSMIFHNPSATAIWDAFINIIHTAIDLFVPKQNSAKSCTRRKHYPLYLRKLTAKKRLLWKKCKANQHDPLIQKQYSVCVNNWRQELRSFHKQAEIDIVESDNLGNFYRYVNKRLTYRRDLSALIDTDGTVVVDDVEKASLFNSYFASVGVVDNGVIPVCDSVLSSDTVIETVEFNSKCRSCPREIEK